MTRSQKILSLVALVQLILVVVVFWPRNTGVVEAQPLLADFSADSVTTLTVEDSDGNIAELERAETGWVVTGTDGFSADISKVNTLLSDLEALSTGRVVAETASSHARLQVADDDFNRKVTLTHDGSEEIILIGSQASGSATHMRHADTDTVYLTNGISPFEVNAPINTWIEPTYVNHNADDIDRFQLENANGSFEFARDEDGNWTWADLPEGGELDASQINLLVSRFTTVRMTRPLGKTSQAAYGLDTPQATVQAILSDGSDVSFAVGAEDADGTFFAKYSESDFYVTVAAFTVEAMVGHSAENFIIEPTPDATENNETP